MKRLHPVERWGAIALMLVAWALRWVLLMDAPPGWRDDDLIEVYTFSQRIVEEGPVLYFTGASGHEPLFHTLRAPIIAFAGINQASARWLSAAAGTLTTLLTWTVGRRTIGRHAAFVGAVLVTVSFWSLMYSRVAIRHIGTLPWALMAVYWGWRILHDGPNLHTRRSLIGTAVGVGGAVLTYYAGRLVPVLLLLMYPIAGPRRGRWRPYMAAIALGMALALPMFYVAAQTTGADARVSELALPVHALLEGNLSPLLQTAWTTLGMAHARGDPEWLYNISERSVFGAAGAVAFYGAIAFALCRWRRPQSRVLLLWLAVGVSPALISLPPSSYGHTILALPAAYLLLASPIEPLLDLPHWMRRITNILALLLVALVATRDIGDYFQDWSGASMVKFLYRADYRSLASFLDVNGDIRDASVGSMLFGPWDKVSLKTDLLRRDVRIRWASPERALVFASGAPTLTYLQDEGQRSGAIQAILSRSRTSAAPEGLQGYVIEPVVVPVQAVQEASDGRVLSDTPFAGALVLRAASRLPSVEKEASVEVITWWEVIAPLPLPAEELVPYPPPPGVYSGPRLSIFAHLSHDDEPPAVDDGLWVDPHTLMPGDTFIQVHTFPALSSVDAPLVLTMGVYDPMTGARWNTSAGGDGLSLELTP